MEILITILILIISYLLWKKLEDNKISKNHKNVIYVLDRLLDFSVRDWEHKKLDFNLYKILNSPEVYQEAIHMNIYPVIEENKKMSKESIEFFNNLWMYIVYDIRTDFLFTKTVNDLNAQKNIYEKISSIRQKILSYLFEKKLITDEVFNKELNYEIKKLIE